MKVKIFKRVLESKALNRTVKAIVSNAPKILTGISIASSIAATGFAIKGTILAVEIEKQRKAKIESGELPVPEHPKWEVVKSVYKCYIPAFTFLSVSVGASLYGTSISTARTMMATAACRATEMAFDEYRTKVIEELGSEKEKTIEQTIAKEHAEQSVVQPNTMLINPYSTYPCMEKYSGQIIMADINDIKDIYNRINYDLLHNGQDYISLADYCERFEIDCRNESIGWNLAKSGGMLVLRWDLGTDRNGVPLLIFYASTDPTEDYAYYG